MADAESESPSMADTDSDSDGGSTVNGRIRFRFRWQTDSDSEAITIKTAHHIELLLNIFDVPARTPVGALARSACKALASLSPSAGEHERRIGVGVACGRSCPRANLKDVGVPARHRTVSDQAQAQTDRWQTRSVHIGTTGTDGGPVPGAPGVNHCSSCVLETLRPSVWQQRSSKAHPRGVIRGRDAPGCSRCTPVSYRRGAISAGTTSPKPVLAPLSLASPGVRVDGGIGRNAHRPVDTRPVQVTDHKCDRRILWRPA